MLSCFNFTNKGWTFILLILLTELIEASTSIEKEQSPFHEVSELMSEAPHTEKLTPKSSSEISSSVKLSSSPEVSIQPEIVPKIEEESKVVKPVNRQLEFNDEIKEVSDYFKKC